MSQEIIQLKRELFREAFQQGWYTPAMVKGEIREAAGSERIQRWYARLYEESEPLLPKARFLNNFLVGADPEFMFMTESGRYDARNLGMKAGLAFGADNNGRLVELRPEPARSALSVLSSIWLTMRWMAVYAPKSTQYSWRSGAYCEQDGLGGHIHYGRKREYLRTREVASLDRITHLLFTAGIFDREEGRLRFRQGQGGHYGGLSDIRKQPHGYEYRSLPSWMDSPWLAYFNLVIGKLVVAAPELLPPLSSEDSKLNPEQARGMLKMLLAHFKGVDDDARLAYAILGRQGFPQHNSGQDIKTAWGLFVGGPLGNTEGIRRPQVYPTTIPSYTQAEEELAEALFESRSPSLDTLEVTWKPSTLPDKYSALINNAETRLAPGLGEFVADLCCADDYPISIQHFNEPMSLDLIVNVEWRGRMERLDLDKKYSIEFSSEVRLTILKLRTGGKKLAELYELKRDLLASGVFPLWRIKDVQASSFKEYMKSNKQPDKAASAKSRVIFNTQGIF